MGETDTIIAVVLSRKLAALFEGSCICLSNGAKTLASRS